MAVKIFLKKSIAKAEMASWNSANKGSDKTTTTTTKQFQRLNKRLNEFFNLPPARNFGEE